MRSYVVIGLPCLETHSLTRSLLDSLKLQHCQGWTMNLWGPGLHYLGDYLINQTNCHFVKKLFIKIMYTVKEKHQNNKIFYLFNMTQIHKTVTVRHYCKRNQQVMCSYVIYIIKQPFCISALQIRLFVLHIVSPLLNHNLWKELINNLVHCSRLLSYICFLYTTSWRKSAPLHSQ